MRSVEPASPDERDRVAEVLVENHRAFLRLFRARSALRKQVAASCGTCAEHGCLDCSCGKP